MGFKRATWHSGLTYQNICPRCNTQITYTDRNLDFRPWFPDGFVYCQTCKTPLRHSETLAINRPDTPIHVDMTTPTRTVSFVSSPKASLFCSNCGRAFLGSEIFCPACGKKR